MEIVSGIAAINGSLKIIKAIQEIDKGLSEAEYKIKITELYSALADAKMALIDAKEEIHAKDKEIASLKSQFSKSTNLVEINGYSFDTDDGGNPKGYAFCPTCHVDQGKFYRLVDCILPDRTNCNKCKSTFPTSDTLKR